MVEVQNGGFSNPELKEKLKEMWNTEEYADTIFLVNETKFYGSSHLVSVMSSVLKADIKNHFEHCGDRELRIGNIKCNEGFSTILRYIYGMEIEFTDMDRVVLCELLSLSERFDLPSFTAELKSFISNLDCFQLDSLVVLLNTAKKYEMKDLYEKLTVFAFENASQLVKHASFVDLQYDVLHDLLKSDYFLAQEVDILLETFKWHKSNINEISYHDKGNLAIEIPNTDEAGPSLASSDALDNITDVLKIIQSTDEASGLTDRLNTSVLKENANINCNNVSPNNSAVTIPDPNMLETFSDKVLKSLLMYVRIKQISVLDFMNVLKSDLVKPHKDILLGCTFTACCEPRRKFALPTTPASEKSKEVIIPMKDSLPSYYPLCYYNILCDTMYSNVREFTLYYSNSWPPQITSYENKIIGDFQWNVSMEIGTGQKTTMYLSCTGINIVDWECVTEFQMIILSNDVRFRSCVFPDSSVSTHFKKAVFYKTCDSQDPITRVKVGTCNLPINWKQIYLYDQELTVEVYFQYIHKTVKEIRKA